MRGFYIILIVWGLKFALIVWLGVRLAKAKDAQRQSEHKRYMIADTCKHFTKTKPNILYFGCKIKRP